MARPAVILGAPISPGWLVAPRRIRISTVDGQQLVQEHLAPMINREPGSTVLHDAEYGRRGTQWEH